MKIFISHSAEDRETAGRLAKGLQEAGHRVWMPEEEIFPGDNWAEAVSRALEEAEAMVVLLTEAGLRSMRVKREMLYALGEKRFEDRLIPVAVGPRDQLPKEDLPWVFDSMRWLTLDIGSEGDTAREIAHALSPAFA
jgi:hypothetical protein